MATDQITPGISTHFRWVGLSGRILTTGRIYKILEWEGDYYHFLDDNGESKGRRCRWGPYDAEDVSYEENLQEILE